MEQAGALLSRLTSAASGSSAIYTAVAFTAVAWLASLFLAKPEAYKATSLPAWTPLEIALTSYLVSSNGLGRRI